jgi:hypothetical protein
MQNMNAGAPSALLGPATTVVCPLAEVATVSGPVSVFSSCAAAASGDTAQINVRAAAAARILESPA